MVVGVPITKKEDKRMGMGCWDLIVFIIDAFLDPTSSVSYPEEERDGFGCKGGKIRRGTLQPWLVVIVFGGDFPVTEHKRG